MASELGLPQFLGKEEMPQVGWTETVDLDAIDLPATIDRIRTLAAFVRDESASVRAKLDQLGPTRVSDKRLVGWHQYQAPRIEHRPRALVPAVVGLVGPMNPGRGATVNVPADLFDEARKATTDGHIPSLVDWPTEMGMRRADVSSLIRMCRGIRALGQIGAIHYVGRSPRLGPWVIGFHRTALGTPQLAQLAEQLLKAGRAREPQPRHAW